MSFILRKGLCLFEKIPPSLLRQPSRTLSLIMVMGFPGDSDGKESVCSAGDPGVKEMATRSNILAWKIPWIAEPGGLQSWGCKELGRIERLTLSLSISNSS
jgi:hypothetical protein